MGGSPSCCFYVCFGCFFLVGFLSALGIEDSDLEFSFVFPFFFAAVAAIVVAVVVAVDLTAVVVPVFIFYGV